MNRRQTYLMLEKERDDLLQRLHEFYHEHKSTLDWYGERLRTLNHALQPSLRHPDDIKSDAIHDPAINTIHDDINQHPKERACYLPPALRPPYYDKSAQSIFRLLPEKQATFIHRPSDDELSQEIAELRDEIALIIAHPAYQRIVAIGSPKAYCKKMKQVMTHEIDRLEQML